MSRPNSKANEATQCLSCRGEGEVDCYECRGSGCVVCRGTGKIDCSRCNGFGSIKSDGTLYESKASLKAMKASGAGDMIDDIPDGMDLDEWLNESKASEKITTRFENDTVYHTSELGGTIEHSEDEWCSSCDSMNESKASEVGTWADIERDEGQSMSLLARNIWLQDNFNKLDTGDFTRLADDANNITAPEPEWWETITFYGNGDGNSFESKASESTWHIEIEDFTRDSGKNTYDLTLGSQATEEDVKEKLIGMYTDAGFQYSREDINDPLVTKITKTGESKASEDYFEDEDGNVSSVMKWKLVYDDGSDYGFQTDNKAEAQRAVDQWNETNSDRPIKIISQESKASESISDNNKQILGDWVSQNRDWTTIDDLPDEIFVPLMTPFGDDIDKRVEAQVEIINYMKSLGESNVGAESWSQKSSINRIEALERVGVKQGDAIKLSSLEFDDFGEDLQGALEGDARDLMNKEKDFLDKNQEELDREQNSTGMPWQQGGEVDNPNSEFQQSYPDYNNIGKSQTGMTSYECQYCDSGFKSNEALSIHHNDKHAIAPESFDGYATEGYVNIDDNGNINHIGMSDVPSIIGGIAKGYGKRLIKPFQEDKTGDWEIQVRNDNGGWKTYEYGGHYSGKDGADFDAKGLPWENRVVRRGSGYESKSTETEYAMGNYTDWFVQVDIPNTVQCDYCSTQFNADDQEGMISHINSTHDAGVDPVTGDTGKSWGESYAQEDDLDTLMWDNENPDDKYKQWKDKKGKKEESKASEFNIGTTMICPICKKEIETGNEDSFYHDGNFYDPNSVPMSYKMQDHFEQEHTPEDFGVQNKNFKGASDGYEAFEDWKTGNQLSLAFRNSFPEYDQDDATMMNNADKYSTLDSDGNRMPDDYEGESKASEVVPDEVMSLIRKVKADGDKWGRSQSIYPNSHFRSTYDDAILYGLLEDTGDDGINPAETDAEHQYEIKLTPEGLKAIQEDDRVNPPFGESKASEFTLTHEQLTNSNTYPNHYYEKPEHDPYTPKPNACTKCGWLPEMRIHFNSTRWLNQESKASEFENPYKYYNYNDGDPICDQCGKHINDNEKTIEDHLINDHGMKIQSDSMRGRTDSYVDGSDVIDDGYESKASEVGMHGGDGASFYDGKTFTCDKCGKVGDSFTDMAQEECPADVNANHQIPIFGDQVKPRGIGESKASEDHDSNYDYLENRDTQEDHVCAECGFVTSDNSEYIDHLNSHEE